MNRLEVGNRVRSNAEFSPVPHEGTVKSIAIGFTGQGPTVILQVMIDRQNGEQIEPHLHETPALHWEQLNADGSTESLMGAKLPEAPKCPTCGEVHKGPDYFTPEMIALHAKLASTPEEEREAVYVELASRFMVQVSELDTELPDRIHKLVAKAQDAGDQARRALLRVGRMVVKNLDKRSQHMQGAAHIRQLFMIPVPVPAEKSGGLN